MTDGERWAKLRDRLAEMIESTKRHGRAAADAGAYPVAAECHYREVQLREVLFIEIKDIEDA